MTGGIKVGVPGWCADGYLQGSLAAVVADRHVPAPYFKALALSNLGPIIREGAVGPASAVLAGHLPGHGGAVGRVLKASVEQALHDEWYKEWARERVKERMREVADSHRRN